MKKIRNAVKEIQSQLIEGERVVISRTGIDIDLMEEDEAPETLLQIEEFVRWLKLVDREKRELAIARNTHIGTEPIEYVGRDY